MYAAARIFERSARTCAGVSTSTDAGGALSGDDVAGECRMCGALMARPMGERLLGLALRGDRGDRTDRELPPRMACACCSACSAASPPRKAANSSLSTVPDLSVSTPSNRARSSRLAMTSRLMPPSLRSAVLNCSKSSSPMPEWSYSANSLL